MSDYNVARAHYGLGRVDNFEAITSDADVANALKAAYGSVDNIDAYIGGLAEDHVEGSELGPLFRTSFIQQFTRTRAADRLWYENQFPEDVVEKIRKTTIGDLIRRNSGLGNEKSFADRDTSVLFWEEQTAPAATL